MEDDAEGSVVLFGQGCACDINPLTEKQYDNIHLPAIPLNQA